MAPSGNADLVVRVAANISALQADMAQAASSIKTIETATTNASAAAGGFTAMLDNLGHSFVARVTEGILLRDAVHELISLGEEAFTDAARFDDLSRATGISIKGVQELSYVGKEFGIDTEQMGRGVEQLSARLAGGDASATRAVQMLGLSVKDLIAAGPMEAFLQIAEATGRVQDPMLKGALASDEFGGKIAKVLLPALGELRPKLDEAGKSAAIMSDETVKAAKNIDVEMEKASVRFKTSIAEMAMAVVHAFALAEGPPLERVAKDIELVHQEGDKLTSTAELLQNRLTALRADALVPLTQAQREEIEELHKWGVSEKETADLVGATVGAVHLAIQSHHEEEESLKKLMEAYDKLHVLTLNNDRKIRAENAKLEEAEAKIVNAAIVAEFEAQVKLNAAMGLDAAGAIQVQTSAAERLRIGLLDLHKVAVDGISQKAQEQVLTDAYTKSLFDEAVAQDATYQALLKSNDATKESIRLKTQAMTLSFNNPLGSANASNTDPAIQRWIDQGYTLNEAMAIAGGYGENIIGHAGAAAKAQSYASSHRASGGPVSAGSSYVVGERGPELFVPGSNGSIVPNGGGGISVTNHITISQPLGTPDAIARAVDDAMMASLRGRGLRLPVGA